MEPGTSINNKVGLLTLAAGNKLSLLENPNGTFTFSHDTTAVSDLTASGRKYVTGLTFDDYGHVTGFTTGTETVVDTTYTAGTGLELKGTTFNNTAPDQEVVLNAGSNVSITGTYPNFTINSSFTDTNTTYDAGIKLTLDGTTFNHEELASPFSTQADTSTTLSGIEFLSNLTVDSSGHISSGKFKKLVSGENVSITPSANGNITISSTNTTYTAGTKLTPDGTTFNHDLTSRTDTTNTGSSGFGGTISVVDSVSSDSTGHLTAINTKTITLPSETKLSLDITGSGNFISAQSVSNHKISLTKTNTTEDKITVGELLVSNSGTGTGNVIIQGNLTVEGTTTEISTTELKVEDNVITLNAGAATAALNAGIEVNRGTDPNYEITFVEATQDFRIGQTGDLQPVLTRDEISGLTNLDLLT